jgi:hypothetical protein
MLTGALPCRSVGVWVSTFTLDEDAATDPTPRFVAAYTGAAALTAKLPAVTGRCAAAAVYFSVDAAEAAQTSAAASAAAAVRGDLAYWPASTGPTVPGAPILAGRASGVLAATVVGDPSRCSPGESVATPFAAVGDCWLAAGAGFRTTTCGVQHTHEVYWVESLTTKAYLAQNPTQQVSASAWARQRAGEVCAARRSSLNLAHDVTMADVYLEYLWPSALDYPPTGPAGWSKAQIVCLARWQDGRPSSRHLLHR